MIDPADTRFFQALQDACMRSEDVPESCRNAIERAVETGAEQDMLIARQAIDQLKDTIRTDLMRKVHLHMATDLSAIWDAMPSAAGKQRPN